MKALTIRDSMTAIPALAFRVGEVLDRVLDPARLIDVAEVLKRGGFGDEPIDPRYVVLCTFDGDLVAHLDPFAWGNASKLAAHLWLVDHYDELVPGQDLDVESLRLGLGERGRAVVAEPTSIGNPIRPESRGA